MMIILPDSIGNAHTRPHSLVKDTDEHK